MVRGRRPKPTAIKLAEGNLGGRELNLLEPTPLNERPACPEHLSTIAKVHWGEMAERLERLGLLTEIDGDAFALYCDAYGRWVEACDKLQEHGLMLESGGYPVQNPYLAIANKAHEQMRKLLVEFGLTPSARSRVQTNRQPNDKPKGGFSRFAS